MAKDPLGELSKAATKDSQQNLKQRIQREQRVQAQARMTRAICRWTVIGAGLSAFAALGIGVALNAESLYGLACLLSLPTLIAGVILFFMGGMASESVRNMLSESERRKLDE